jgi:DNA-binding CsgD family transcriptional regulator
MGQNPADKRVKTARQFLGCVVQEQRAAAEELRAATRELAMMIEDLLATHPELRTSARAIPVESHAEERPAGTSGRKPGAESLTVTQLKRETDRVLQKGREAIRDSVSQRERSKRVRAALRQESPRQPLPARLSKREHQVLTLIVAGKSSKEIAAELGISFKTAVTHRSSIMGKLDVHEIASVVREAILRGLV